MAIILGFLALVIAYLLGSIPCGLLLAKYKAGIDVRTQGSRNIGATNIMRVCGKKLGAMTFALDALKGAAAVWIAMAFGLGIGVQSLVGLVAVLGHIFPYWLNFKGGKGVATALAVYGALYWPLMIFACLCWIGVFFLSRISSVASLAMMLASLAIAWVYAPTPVGWAVTIINIVVIIRHKENIMRLLRGEELPVKTEAAL